MGTVAKEEDDNYDPHLHRILSHPNNSKETFLHLVKGCLGTGILAMPEAYKYAGLANGLLSTTLIAILNTYVIHVLIRSQYKLCKKTKIPCVTYAESMELALGMGPECLRCLASYAGIITDITLVWLQIGACCVYIIFVSENIGEVIDFYFKLNISIQLYMVMFFIPFFLISCPKNLKFFSYFSLIGNIISILTYCLIVYYVSHARTPFSDLKMVGKVVDYPLFFGTAMFSLQSVTVTVIAESNMDKPEDFLKPIGVWNIAMTIVTILYMFVGSMGYWKYGEKIAHSITLNFPIAKPSGQAVRILYSFSLFISFGLNLLVGVKVFWQLCVEKRFRDASKKKQLVLDYSIRFVFVIITVALAVSVPFLGLVISFIGCVILTTLSFIFPAILEICVYWPNELGVIKWKLWKNICLILIGFFGLTTGMYCTTREVVNRYRN